MFSDWWYRIDPRYWRARTYAVTAVVAVVALLAVLVWSGGMGTGSHQGAPVTTTTSYTQTGSNWVGVGGAGSGPTMRAGVAPVGVMAADQVGVVLDGWSMKNLGAGQLGVSVTPTSPVAPLAFRAADMADVRNLLERAPGLLADAASRMISPASAVHCTSAGCRDAQGAIPLEEFVDPTTIPGLGAEYKGYHITSTLYVSELPIDPSMGFYVRLGSSFTQVNGTAMSAVVPDSSAGVSTNGYQVNRWLVGVGLGQVFSIDPAWRHDVHPELTSWGLAGVPWTPAGGVLGEVRGGGAFSSGLGANDPAAATLSASQLTYMTSPTTGCGPGVLCVPGVAATSVTVASTLQRTACASGYPAGVVDVSATWAHDFTAPTNQWGAWGTQPARFPGTTGSDPFLWTGTPPLVSGVVHLDEQLVYGLEGQVPAVFATGGSVDGYQAGSWSALEQTAFAGVVTAGC
jgi:hypothetical protein